MTVSSRLLATLLSMLVCSIVLPPTGCRAETAAADVRNLYRHFFEAQNRHNIDDVGAQLLDSPDFLWVSDGKSIWGRAATLERMSGFQKSEVWRVEPDLASSKVVDVTDTSAFLHLRLDLVIGAAVKPDRLRFLVSALCVKTGQGWKIAALFTTTAKPE